MLSKLFYSKRNRTSFRKTGSDSDVCKNLKGGGVKECYVTYCRLYMFRKSINHLRFNSNYI